jgi:uncharacterized membrane protein
MKRILLTLLAVVFVLGLFGAAGYAGYRFGYVQGVQATTDGETSRPGLRTFDEMGPRGMLMHNFGFGRGFHHGLGMGNSSMMGFGFFSPFMLLGRIALVALIILFVYWLFTRSGWQLTRTAQTTQAQPDSTQIQAKE